MDNNRFDSGTVIQWYPGHMAKAKRKNKECLARVDIIVEIIDSRIPKAAQSDLRKLTAGKPSVILLNKSDIADEAATSEWIRYFREQNISALAVDCKSGRGLSGFLPLVKKVLADRIAQWKQKGMVSRPVRMMVAGIPNSGKSSFINRMSHGSTARVEDRPGVTRANQWFVTADGSQMLDTPGVLWPKFDDQRVARYLAFTGAIRDEILNIEELAYELLTLLKNDYSELLKSRYKLPEQLPDDSWELLQLIGKLRGMLISGGEVDTERASIMLIDEFRGGRIGRITLEKP